MTDSIQTQTKPLLISADDYGLSAAIDDGIIALIRQGVVTATSCLVMSPRWPAAALHLDTEIRQKADVGLHLDFTEFNPDLRKPLVSLLLAAYAGLLKQGQITTAIHRQLDQFESSLQSAPDYIDGHQHVHQLPPIREALLEVLENRRYASMPWIRVAKPLGRQSWPESLKALIIDKAGAEGLLQHLRQTNIPHTTHLLGVYAFDCNATEYLLKLEQWLKMAQNQQGLCALMCHPASAVMHRSEL